ncbi:MAG: ribosome small subunit-dependent GTPase A, partial [Eubacterium sp.]|nr:ribosome small subunit-dependent GTPase A [Eubacterium sp.]
MEKLKGRILKSVGGIFYAETDMGILGCKAKGLFRIKEIMPCAGDYVSISLDGDVLNTTPVISEV